MLWALLDIILCENLSQRVLAETRRAFEPGTTALKDPDVIFSGPLLTSIFMETLRLRTAGSVARYCTVDNLRLGDWVIPRDSIVLTSSWLAGRDETFWNAGRPRLHGSGMEHPLNNFWAERFLQYPNYPASGPVLPSRRAKYDLDDGAAEASDTSASWEQQGQPRKVFGERTTDDDRQAIVVTKGLQSHYYPFGGGASACPGRAFAKHEIMTAVAVVMRTLEIAPVDHDTARGVRSSVTSFPFGSLAFDRKVPVRVRRRRLGEDE